MTQLAEQNVQESTSPTDLVAAVRRVLEASPEPLTVSKIRASLPSAFRGLSLEEITEPLQRQVAANVLVQYPKYRSQQDRFWDRPMRVHVVNLLRAALAERPLAISELRRKLPDYAKTQAEAVLEEEVAEGRLHRHPSLSSRGGARFSVEPPSPRDFLRTELTTLFNRLARLGFSHAQLRESALELLHEEEWSAAPEPPADQSAPTPTAQPAPDNPGSYAWSEEQTPAGAPVPEPDRPATTPTR
jgi:hypothetical protein